MISNRGKQHDWVVSFDGFYQTRGHHSNNASASLHDYQTGLIAWYQHRTKRGAGHNWEGTSGGSEGDILNSILQEVKEAGFKVAEAVMDHDSSLNAIFCRHFPEATITYCSNHSAKTLHTSLLKVKEKKCEVDSLVYINIKLIG